MSGDLKDNFDGIGRTIKHPSAETIEDVITFRLQLLVAMGERTGYQWLDRLFNLSHNECRLLTLVHSRKHLRAGDLADLLLMDKSQTSRLIKTLLSKGLIQNTPDPVDGRAVLLSMTQAGMELQDRVLEEIMKSNERMLSPLTREEVQAFDAILKKLVGHSQDMLARQAGKALVR